MARQEDRPLNRHEIDRIARIKGQRQQYEAQRNLSPSNERAVSSARFVQDHSSNVGISRIQDGRLVPVDQGGEGGSSGQLTYEQQVNQRAMQIVQESIQAAEGGQGGTDRMIAPSATSAWIKDRQRNAPKAPASRPISPPQKKTQKKNQKKKPPRMTRQQQNKWLKESKRGKNSYGDKI